MAVAIASLFYEDTIISLFLNWIIFFWPDALHHTLNKAPKYAQVVVVELQPVMLAAIASMTKARDCAMPRILLANRHRPPHTPTRNLSSYPPSAMDDAFSSFVQPIVNSGRNNTVQPYCQPTKQRRYASEGGQHPDLRDAAMETKAGGNLLGVG